MKSRVNSKLVTGLEKLVVLKQTPTTQIWSLLFASYLRLTGNIQNERPELSSQCRGTPLSDVLLGSGAILLHQNCQMNRITLLGFPLPGASQDGHDLSLWKGHNCIYLFLPSLSAFWGGPTTAERSLDLPSSSSASQSLSAFPQLHTSTRTPEPSVWLL